MKKLIFMRVDLSLAIAQRLALYYKVDDAFPALSSSLRPKNQEGSGALKDIIGPRSLSTTYQAVFDTIRPAYDRKSGTADLNQNFEQHLLQIESVQKTMLGVMLVKDKEAQLSTGVDPVGLSKTMKALLDEMWAETEIISLVLMSKRTAEDIKDELNTTALSNITKVWLKDLDTERFFSNIFSTMLIGDGTQDKAHDTWTMDLDKVLNYTEVISAHAVQGSNSFGFNEMIDILSSKEKTKRKVNKSGKEFAEKLITHLTTLDCLSQVEKIVAHFSPKDQNQTAKVSVNKEISQLITEMAQVEDLLAVRVFNSLQAWVALTQRSIIPLQRPEAMEYVKHLFSNMASTYDIDGIISEFCSLPIGKMSNDFVNQNEDVTAITHNGTQLTTIISHYGDTNPEDGLDYYAGTVRHVTLSLYPLLKNSELWSLYKKGSVIAGGVTPSFRRVSRSLDALPMVFASFGSYAGDRINNLDDVNWSLMFDWGINKFNSSSRTDVAFNHAEDDELLIRYSHGQIDYQNYKQETKEFLQSVSANGSSGYDFSQKNVPLIAYRRRMIRNATPFLGVDLSIIKLGATCLLPIPPMNYNAVITDAKTDFLDKQVVGSYETEMERLPMNYAHTPPLKGDSVSVHKSIVPQFLRISKGNFDKSEAIGKTLLQRFVSKVPGKPGTLNCSTISEDIFFLSMVNHMFVSPNTWVDPKMYELHLRPFLRLDEGQEEVGAVLAKEIGVHKYIDGQLTYERGLAGTRVMSTCTALDRTDPLPRHRDMGHLNAEHGTIED